VLVDTEGLVLRVVVHPAGLQDRDGAKQVLGPLAHRHHRLRKIWADGGYAGELIGWVKALRPRRRIALEVVKRPEDSRGFEVLPRRWVVERTFGWWNPCRRLSKDYEGLPATSEAWIRIAMIRLMVRRLARL
jgi:putative transposase